MDLEVAKTNLLCKWIVKAMEPGESNLCLGIDLQDSICKDDIAGELAWTGSPTNNIKDSLVLRFGNISIKPERLW